MLEIRPKTKARLAAAYVAGGIASLGFLFWLEWDTFPWERAWLWGLFAVVFVALESRAVEVNDRLLMSPTVMVALTAAVVLGRGGAALGVAVMSGLALATPDDIRQRRWFLPAINFGQLVMTATVSTLVFEQFLPRGAITTRSLGMVAIGAAVAAFVHAVVNLGLVGYAARRAYRRRDIRPWSRMGELAGSYVMMGFLGGLLGAAYHIVGTVTLPFILAIFGVGYLTFASHAELREAHEATLRGFIKALEAKDLYTRGHTERVAHLTRMIGEELGFRGTDLERLRWAALIHDVGKLAVPRDLIRKRGRLTEFEYQKMQQHAHMVEDILAEVEFLRPMVQIASGHHSHFDGNGYGGSGHSHGNRPGIETCILAVADAFDAMTSTRSYRMALSQEYAIAELSRGAGGQFDPDVVGAFVRALERSGERYGSPDLVDEEEARRRAEAAISHVHG